MAYTRTTYSATGTTADKTVDVTKMNNAEQGIADAHTLAQTAVDGVAAKAPLASPTFTGTVTVPSSPTAGTQAVNKLYVDTVTANAQTGTTYTLALSDAGKVIEMSNSAANTVTIPLNSTVAFPVGTVLDIGQFGAGQTTITAATGVTLQSRDNAYNLAGQYASASLRKRATDTWFIVGDVAV